ncbi:dTTP/UTP pyrophosphatase isoform X2 [Athalia rosae]|uniref:dTTP/UTP pyrophosphatase isoform X2 n=1 Tax=Athalia rosae TaxID=37344 RepID=UPI002034103C|nr:dTTP/UTP pyrophosphatase isoform X2 [Athalia rosae]
MIFVRNNRLENTFFIMLESTREILSVRGFILASGSPRRKELIENLVRQHTSTWYFSVFVIKSHGVTRCVKALMKVENSTGLNPEIVSSRYDENLDRNDYKSHGDFVQDLAYFKVMEVYDRLKNDNEKPFLIIGADTIVTIGAQIYGKPKDSSDAVRMLSILAGQTHTVYTGVFLKTMFKEVKFFEKTDVKFGDIKIEQIEAYVKTGEPLDKAGGYGIQGVGGCLVESINGDFFTVMGLPLFKLTKHLNEICTSGFCDQ